MPPKTTVPQSFIPHEVPTVNRPARVRGRGLSDLFTLITVVLFVASFALAAGVFLYGEYLQSGVTSKVDQLERAKAAFEPSLIQELTRFDDRMRAAGEVLGRHISPTALFDMLEQTTITTVMFTGLDFNASDLQKITMEMEGIAASVNSIALQADLFSKGGMVASPIFSDIDRRTGGVHFSVAAQLNPGAINYTQRSAVAPGGAAPVPQPSGVFPFSGSPPPSNAESPQEPSLEEELGL